MARGPNRRRIDREPGEAGRRLARTAALVLPAVAAVALLGGAAWGAWRWAFRGEALRIHAIRFEGLARATEKELLELSPVQVGDPILVADVGAMEAALARHPWIAGVEIRRRLPAALDVRVVERRAAGLVELGALYLADANGHVFKRAAPGDGLDLPLVTGISRDEYLARAAEVEPVIAAALTLVERWNARGLDRRAPISEVHVDPDWGTTVYAGAEGMEVRLGNGGLEEKLTRLDRVLSALDAEGETAEVLHLDNRRRPDWVAVRVAGRHGETDSRSVVAMRAKGPPDAAVPERAGKVGRRPRGR